MAGRDTELMTADGRRLDWTTSSEAYADDEVDAYLAKVLDQMDGCQSTAVTAARYKKALTGSSTIAKKLSRLARSSISDAEMKRIAAGNDWVRQAALASNPFITEPIAQALMNSLNAFVRRQLAGNASASDLVLRRLQRDPDADVQRAAESVLLGRESAHEATTERSGRRRRRRRR
ncbi:MAG: hypothetical protein AAGD18_00545 [Actinomycetota bacterium]